MKAVSENNSLSIKEYILVMISAADGGHIEIVQLMLSIEANDYNSVMDSAAVGGHIEIQLMLLKGAKNYYQAIQLLDDFIPK